MLDRVATCWLILLPAAAFAIDDRADIEPDQAPWRAWRSARGFDAGDQACAKRGRSGQKPADSIGTRVFRQFRFAGLASGKVDQNTDPHGHCRNKNIRSVPVRPALFRGCILSAPEREALLDAFLRACRWTRIYYLWRPNLPSARGFDDGASF
jgi:hypothetical protein